MYKSNAQFQNSFLGNFAYREIIDRHQDNVLVKLNNSIDLSFIEPLVSDCYCQENGASAYHPAGSLYRAEPVERRDYDAWQPE